MRKARPGGGDGAWLAGAVLVLAISAFAAEPAQRLVVAAPRPVNVFVGAGTNYGVLEVVRPGDLLEPCGRRGAWFLVCLSDGRQGYILARWVRPAQAEPLSEKTSAPETPTPPAPAEEVPAPEVSTETPAIENSFPTPGRSAYLAAQEEAMRRQYEQMSPDRREAVAAEAKAIAERINAASPGAGARIEEAAPTPAPEPPPVVSPAVPVAEPAASSAAPAEKPKASMLDLARTALRDPDAQARVQAVDELASHRTRAVPVLLSILNSGDDAVRERAAVHLGEIGGAPAVDGLMKVVANPYLADTVRIAAVRGLVRQRATDALPLLRQELERAAGEGYREALRQAIADLGD